MTLYLSKLTLSREPSIMALNALLDPAAPPPGRMDAREQGRRTDAHHRLVWSAFAGDPEATRDFLWREEGRGVFYTLSKREPAGSPLFGSIDTKEFTPELKAGDRLGFLLRANATRMDSATRKRADVVMHALYDLPEGERGPERMKRAQMAAAIWMEEQGSRNGFAPVKVSAGDYRTAALPGYTGRRKGQPQYGILDLSGTLRVTEPEAFLARLGQGFGRAKAFGCGLMMIRRAP